MHPHGTDHYYRGARIADVPDGPGIYAWYYKPRTRHWPLIAAQLTRLLDSSVQFETTAVLRYGIQLRGSAAAKVFYQADKQELGDAIANLSEAQTEMIISFLTDESFLQFSRPLYIGIARSLNKRVYDQHYISLCNYWDDNSDVNGFLQSNPNATVEQVAATVQIKRSFALEARTRGLAPTDLVVYAFPTNHFTADLAYDEDSDEEDMRRSLEKILHLLADPICGRR